METETENKSEERRKSIEVPVVRKQRKLPTIPASEAQKMDKLEERRLKAQELLRQHRIRPSTKAVSIASEGGAVKAPSAKKDKYRDKARQMLEEHFGTPEITRRHSGNETTGRPKSEGNMSSFSSHPIGEEKLEEPPEKEDRGRTEEEEEGEAELQREKDEEVGLEQKSSPPSVSVPERATDDRTNHVHERDTPSPTPRRKIGVVMRPPAMSAASPVGQVLYDSTQGTERPCSATVREKSTAATHTPGRERIGSSGSEMKEMRRGEENPSSPSPPPSLKLSGPSREKSGPAQRKARQGKTALKAKPVSTQPSAAALRLMQLKKERERGVEPDGAAAEGQGEGGEGGEEDVPVENGHPPGVERSTSDKSLESPWSSDHSERLVQDILLTQSEYVRCELNQLQIQLQQLEKRAMDIESDIRESMSSGNKEEEEALMQEWFLLLNSKNELIKRQIELNLVEREEDLEKRQFFLNRELRPLMQLPEEQKTPQQKNRADTLLTELLDLIDERDKLERRKMLTSRNTEGLEAAKTQTSNNTHRRGSMEKQGGKDCVIS